ncbi:MAG: glycosyl transferase [Bacteroidetes bacterium GWE2_39_28]|nr:MAG: glycosyl transferase [Bacteroidetes bacterium GWE2_39_28]OFY13563.1 MAG: glycosyl transferase [Bacteroidetes bacterium GWF2_39_10]OFZ07335.1 MAG: glycosyl transferase [Bacteroidetes bacterium RIFOXYB2_FULL_39_7]OFZ11723.1 MAG: glycosyl transferase [Bacteroidetes bacterium RIFOXYC2_FULL_39_11]HCT94900.1 glycosyl transferase [Rikenellaceae bacterium]
MGIIHIIDVAVYIITAISVFYVFVFSLSSVIRGGVKYRNATKKMRFLVLIPSYKDDNVIKDSVNSVLACDYPGDKLLTVVISDKMEDTTNEWLLDQPITLFTINPQKSSKAYALNFAIENLEDKNFDIVVILDSDNIIEKEFFNEINNAFYSGSTAVQTHRTAKNIKGDIAILDAISEEINNSIFRKGHVNMGLSSALIGSGMAFSYKWFTKNVTKLSTAGEDKELELLLLKEGVYIDYLDHVPVYDEKTRNKEVFYNQRRRWLAAQFGSLFSGIKELPGAILSGKIDYIDKLFQWTLLPRVVTLGLIFIFAVFTSLYDWRLSIKWWLSFMLLTLSFAMATPDHLVTKDSIKAIKRVPLLFVLMAFNMFRLKGVNKKFIHTIKGE